MSRTSEIPDAKEGMRSADPLPQDVLVWTFDGESLYRAPIRFDLAAGTTPKLTIQLTPRKGWIMLTVQYGDRKLVKELKR